MKKGLLRNTLDCQQGVRTGEFYQMNTCALEVKQVVFKTDTKQLRRTGLVGKKWQAANVGEEASLKISIGRLTRSWKDNIKLEIRELL
jgi:hypothetical protein